HERDGTRLQTRLECPEHGVVPREETVKGFEVAKDEFVRFEPEELKTLEQASSSAVTIDAFVPQSAIDPVYVEDTYYLGSGKNGERGYRVLVRALEQTNRVAVGTFTWRGKTTPIAIRVRDHGLVLQRLYFAGEVQDAGEIDRGADPKIRDQERTLAERLIAELSSTAFHPEAYEDEYRKRLQKAIEQKVAGQEGRGAGDPAAGGRGAPADDRSDRHAQGESRPETAGEGTSRRAGAGVRAGQAAGPAPSRLLSQIRAPGQGPGPRPPARSR